MHGCVVIKSWDDWEKKVESLYEVGTTEVSRSKNCHCNSYLMKAERPRDSPEHRWDPSQIGAMADNVPSHHQYIIT